MKSVQIGAVVAMLAGLGATVGGLFLVSGYVREAVIARIGDPDQSLLFWYLPLLFMGLFALILGMSLVAWGWRRLRS